MSAPLVINLRDGSVWERRAVTAAGVALYALAGSCKCPEYLMASESELAAQGIAGTADALPAPVVPGLSERDRLRAAYIEALKNAHKTHPCPALGDQLWTGCVHYDVAGRMVGVGVCHSERRADAVLAVRDVELERLQSQVAALLEERHVTNEALSDAAEALRADRDRIAELEKAQGLGDRERVELLAGFEKALEPFCAEPGAAAAAVAAVRDPDREWLLRDAQRLQDRVIELEARAAAEADGITARIAPTQALREDAVAPKCRCDEPGADPYSCEADDCTGEFSELNPFGGGPVQGHDAKVSRTCETCGWKTSVWHVADGSAEEELHGHVTRVHGGIAPEVSR